MFTGDPTQNEEHVIPRWLQSRFKLWSQTLYIPNGTNLQYRYAKIPVAQSANTKFGVIENNISRGIYNPLEVYLWALKIHIGFIYRDGSLPVDRTDPSQGTILNIDDYRTEIALFRMMFDVWRCGGTFTPKPPGTVIVLDALDNDNDFDLIHDLVTGTIVVQIANKILYVSLWDQGDGAYANLLQSWWSHHVPMVKFAKEEDRQATKYAAYHVWACETSYWLWRQRRSITFMRAEKSFTLVPPLSRGAGRVASETELAHICRSFGLRLRKFGGEVSNEFETVSDPLAP